jgi:hypothetical protein
LSGTGDDAMRYTKIILGCWLAIFLCTSAWGYDFQQGMHGMKWGSSVAQNTDLKKVHETELAAYYAKPETFYQVSNQPIPGVFYGFFDDKLFAVFVKLRSPNQFTMLKEAFTTKYGDPKSSFNSLTKQRVYRWKDGDVKIKLKMIEAKGQFKMAFYYSPLSTELNEERLENIPDNIYPPIPPEAESAKTKPLLSE